MAEKSIIICSSQTEAQKVAYHLSRCGIDGYPVKPPRDKRRTSCTYGVRIREQDRLGAAKCMQEKGFDYHEII
jgi:hypothetical protein